MSLRASPSNTPVLMERRQWRRTSIYQEAFCQFKNQSNEEVFVSGHVLDISRGGMKFLAPQRMEPGTAFRIGIADGIDGLFTLLSSRVVYVDERPGPKYFVGCTFTPILREDILAWIQNIGYADGSSDEALTLVRTMN